MIVGLVASTGRASLSAALASLKDCDDIIVVEDINRRGQAWTRNELLARAPSGSIVRFVDEDDVAMNTRRMADRLQASGADVLAASFVSGSVRETVPTDPLAAAIDSVGPWSWVAKVDAIRSIPWDAHRTRSTGTWHWLAMIDAGLRFEFAPDLWGYHWLPQPGGVTASVPQGAELIDELNERIRAAGRFELLLPLMARARRAGMPVALPRLEAIGSRFKRTFGRYPNIRAPRTFSEKMATRKAFDSNPIFATWCDKLAARRWAADRLGRDMAPRVLCAGDAVPAILPPQFMAKANHGSGWFKAFDLMQPGADTAAIREEMAGWLARSYGEDKHEEAYSEARRAVILEELLPDVRDVRAFVFDGRVEVIMTEAAYRAPGHVRDFYDRENQWLPASQLVANNPTRTRIDDIAPAIAAAETLGRGVDHVRVDFVESRGRLYFVEMTPFASGGNLPFSAGFDEWLGEFWTMTPALQQAA